MAGLLGSFSYAFLTEPHMANLTPKVALLIQLFIPVLFAIAYFILLEKPESIYSPSLSPKTWIVPKGYDDFIVSKHRVPQRQLTPWERVQLIVVYLLSLIPYQCPFPANASLNDPSCFRLCRRVHDQSRNDPADRVRLFPWFQPLPPQPVQMVSSALSVRSLHLEIFNQTDRTADVGALSSTGAASESKV